MIKEYLKKDGTKAYMLVTYLGIDPITGKQKQIKRSGFKTKREAKIAESRIQSDFDKHGFDFKPEKMTFKEAYEGWLAQYSLTVRESSLQVVKALVSKGIVAEIGCLPVSSITRRQAQGLVKKWHSKYKTFRKYKVYATQIMNYALEEGAITSNPFDKIKTPRDITEDIEEESEKFYTKEELQQFLEFVKDDVMYYAIFRVLAFTGIRKGELMALQWGDINFKDKSMSITNTVTYGENGRQYVGQTKTKSSKRIVMLDPATIEAINKWKVQQRVLLFKFGYNANAKSQFIFTNCSTNELLSKMTITHKLWSVCKTHNFKKIKLHGFRHTCCSLLFEAGLNAKEVQSVLGHSNIKTTLDIYAHVTKTQQENAAEKLANYVSF